MAGSKADCIREAQRIATLKRSAARKERDNKGKAIGELWTRRIKEAKAENDQLHKDREREFHEDLAEIGAWYLDQVEGCQK